MSTSRDPVRLVLDPACPDSERGLLVEGANIAPPRGAEDRVWLALVGAIGVGAAGAAAEATTGTVTATTTTTTSTAAKVEAGLTPVKIVGLAAVLAAAVAVATYLAGAWGDGHKPTSVAPVAPAETSAVVPPQPPPLPPAAETPAVDEAAPTGAAERARPAPGVRHPVRSATPAAANPLRQEITLIKEARQALREGHAAHALRVLEECRRLHPDGVLVQERERLTVEALIAAGRAAEASARAAAFLRRYPDSPHAGEVRELGRKAAGDR
jgi:hypothetical protein